LLVRRSTPMSQAHAHVWSVYSDIQRQDGASRISEETPQIHRFILKLLPLVP
jgi:hypothetical protein